MGITRAQKDQLIDYFNAAEDAGTDSTTLMAQILRQAQQSGQLHPAAYRVAIQELDAIEKASLALRDTREVFLNSMEFSIGGPPPPRGARPRVRRKPTASGSWKIGRGR